MPSSCDSSPGSPNSPSLVNALRQFRFMKKTYSRCAPGTPNAESIRMLHQSPNETPSSGETSIVPETPESIKIKKEKDTELENGNEANGFVKENTPTSSESPIAFHKLNHASRILSDSDPDCATPDELNYNNNNIFEDDEVDVFTDKEKSLRGLMNRYPNKDLMQLQDILVANDWNMDRAIAQIKGIPLPPLPPPPPSPPPPPGTPTSFLSHTPVQETSSDSAASNAPLSSMSTTSNSASSNVSQSAVLVTKREESLDTSFAESKAALQVLLSNNASDSTTARSMELPIPGTNALIKIEPPSPPDSPAPEGHQASASEEAAMLPLNSTKPCSVQDLPCASKDTEASVSSVASLRAYRRISTFSKKPVIDNKHSVASNTNLKQETSNISALSSACALNKSTLGVSDARQSLKEVKKEVDDSFDSAAHSSNQRNDTCKGVANVEQNSNKRPEFSNKYKATIDKSKTPLHSRTSLEAKRKSLTKRKAENENKSRDKRRKIEVNCSDDSDGNEYRNDCVYDSEDSDCGNEGGSSARAAVMAFLESATAQELMSVPKCSKKKVENIIQLRPFLSWNNMVQKIENSKHLTTDILNGVKQLLNAREVITKLMKRCLRISEDIGQQVENLLEEGSEVEGCITEQPELLNEKMCLAPYQMLGLNWLALMHSNQLNGVLADEMGLGKTVQAIAFLAYLQEQKEQVPHLIVVPSSTMDNWLREFQVWCPSLNVFCYHGSQELRRELRMQILNDEVDDFDVIVTTYNMVTTSAEDRSLFKKLSFHYVIFDEAHMLKNMASQRYQALMKIRAKRRLLLTGTPLQNNLVELMSLLIFVMPDMFHGKVEEVKQMFSGVCKTDESRSNFERKRIEHAKKIMRPFFLRRLKSEVLQQLPQKTEEIRMCPFVESQKEQYDKLVAEFSKEVQRNKEDQTGGSQSGAGMMMQLRKAANHPLLLRRHFTDEILQKMAQCIVKEPTHRDSVPALVVEDMQVMSDYELHRLCHNFQSLSSFKLSPEIILESGKFTMLDNLLPQMKERGDRVLLFSQFTMMLDILEEYMSIRQYRHIRLDGTTPVPERQLLIDMFNDDEEIFVFLLSTRAGGLGINLTAANVVLIHDIDFNPYNDKQAEDRCHRVGQTRPVSVMRLISENSIEEGILRCAQDKLKLEKDLQEADKDEETEDQGNVAQLLKSALGL